jgi:bacillolysin
MKLERTFRTTLIGFLFLSAIGFRIANQNVKSSNDSTKHPFTLKLEGHHNIPDNSLERQTFNDELQNLSRMISYKKKLLTRQLQKQFSGSEILSRLSQISNGTLKVYWNEKQTLPIFIEGSQLQEKSFLKAEQLTESNLAFNSMVFLLENKELLHIENPEKELKLVNIQQDDNGLTHLHYQQVYQGLEIWGRDIRVHINRDGLVESFNGRYTPTPSYLSVENILLNKNNAEEIVRNEFIVQANEVNSRELIYVDVNEKAHVIWLINIKKGLAENWYYFVDANTGKILKKYNHIMTDGPVTGSGVDLFNETRTLNLYQIGNDYLLIDASKPMFNLGSSTLPQDGKGVIYTLDARNADSTLFFVNSSDANNWASKTSVSASANGAMVYDFYNQLFNRNAIDGTGSTMNIIVNFNKNFNNAFWNGQYMVFGNGDGNDFSDLAGAIDVTAHEMSHGVVERTANLIYENQSGALNESFADVFGVLFEFWVEGENGDWLLGEDVTTPGISGDALRNMADPGATNVAFNGQQPTKMSEFQNLPNTQQGDNGGVHINSGIPNRAFYLFATNPAVGIDNAGEIYYNALTKYLTRNSQFIDCRLAVIKATEDKFGAGSPAITAAMEAFDAVEVFDGTRTPEPEDLPPVEGQEYLAIIDAQTGFLYRNIVGSEEFIQISDFPLSSRPTFTDAGELIFYVDNTGNLHLAASDGSGDQQITNSGGFSNVSISPNSQFLAATSTFQEPVIYIFDLSDESGNSDKVVQLFTPTTAEGVTTGSILFPDRIDWSSDSRTLMYDAFNIAVNATGDTTAYWDINLLDAETEAIIRLFPPQPPGIDIGNAVFASNTDNIIAFDYVENNQVLVLGLNLNTGDVGQITDNFNSLGNPTFSNDDSKVYYHYIDQNGASIWEVNLFEDGITGDGNDTQVILGAVFPVDFTIGSRPVSVDILPQIEPTEFTLSQNYPNPFNPTTVISWQQPVSGHVSLKIYDILGNEVATLVDEEKSTGSYKVTFEGSHLSSGVYFYKIQTGSFNQIRKMILIK